MKILLIAFTLIVAIAGVACTSKQNANYDLHTQQPIFVLIVDGQNNHGNWPQTTQIMHDMLEETGNFHVDVYRTRFVWNGGELVAKYPADNVSDPALLSTPKTDPLFSPDFDRYDVVISNFGWKAAAWPAETEASFERYMKQGGGLVVVHAANNAFPHWPAFNEMIGLGGWGGRSEQSGPYVYYDENDNLVYDRGAGQAGGHGHQHPFTVTIRQADHPIMQSFPIHWQHAKDELYNRLRGPAKNMTILATAFDSPSFNGSGRHEPVVLTIDYYEGRVFHTTLGHGTHVYKAPTFQQLLIAGTTWAAGH